MKDSIEVNAMIMEYIYHRKNFDSRFPTGYPSQSSYDEDSALSSILIQLRPMLTRRCKHYFGYINDDLLQSGYLELIERIQAYDVKRTDVPVLGYLNRMISCHYFSLKRREGRDADKMCSVEREVLEAIQDPSDQTMCEEEVLHSLLSILNLKERRLISEHILQRKSLKKVCEHMEISYSYAKKLKQTSLFKMREEFNRMALV